MKKILHFIHWRYLKHQYHAWKKDLSHKDALQKFLHTKNGKLAVIIIIAAMIPMTVLGVQQVQNLRQEAAAPTDKPPCNGGATGLLVSPDPSKDGDTITFTHTGAFPPIDQSSFENDDFTGNGARECTFSGSAITCKARYNSTSGKDVSYHTWTFHGAMCYYTIQKPAATPKGSPTPTAQPGGECKGTIVPACDVNNNPIMTLTYDLRGGTEPNCHVDLMEVGGGDKNNQGNKCTSRSGIRVTGLKNNTTYNLVLNNGTSTCSNKSVANAGTKCTGGTNPTQPPAGNGTPTSTPRPGQPTNTPVPGQPTNTPGPGQAQCTKTDLKLDINQSSCTSGGKTKISGSWKISGTNCVIKLYKDGVEINQAKTCTNNAWYTTEGIDAGANYQLKATSDVCTQPLESNSITAKACLTPTPTPTVDPSKCAELTTDVVAAKEIDPNCPEPTKCAGNVCF